MTYLWQTGRGSKSYRIQTDNRKVKDKLNRRNKFRLGAYSLTHELWIYSCEFKRPDIAKKVLKSVTRVNPQIDSEGVIFYE